MPKIEYIPKKFRASSLDIIDKANVIIEEYEAQDYKLNLRQLYYQFVARDLIPNTVRSYKRLGSIVNDARLAGLIDWEAIEDLTRKLNETPAWSSPAGIIKAAVKAFQIDMWEDQEFRIEVWVEKDALIGIVGRICKALRVDYFSCRGYTSQSAQWRAAQRLEGYIEDGKTPVILHLGDHDPSGIDMTRDIIDRFKIFNGRVHEGSYGGLSVGRVVHVDRLALNMDQVEKHNPPSNPAKTTDSRYASYIKLYGDESWELDAMEPQVISDVIEKAVDKYRDKDQWNKDLSYERADRDRLQKAADNWIEVSEFLEDL